MKQNHGSSLKKNFVYQMIYEILIMIIPLVLSPYLSRVLGAEWLGTYAYYFVIANYFVLFSVLGLKNHGKRTIAQCRDDADRLNLEFTNLAILHIAISVICCVAYIGYIFIFAADRFLSALMGFMVLSGLFDISWLYFGLEKFKLTVFRSSIIKILTVAAIFIFVQTQEDLWAYCLIMSVGTLLGQLVLWIPLKKYVQWVKPDLTQITAHFKPVLLLFIPTIAVSLYKLLDKLMLGDMSNHEQLGFFDNAEKIVNFPVTIIASFGAVMLPRISNMVAHKENEESARYTKLSFYYIMWLAYAFAFGLAGIAHIFAPVFWGEEFRSVSVLVMGLCVTLPFVAFANIIRTQFLIPFHKDTAFLSSVIAGAIVNIIINLIWIPKYGALGAVIATIAAEWVVCMVQMACVRKEMPVWGYLKQSLIFIPFAGILFAVVYGMGVLMDESVCTLVLQIVIGMGVYLALSGAYFYYKKDEYFMKLIHRLLHR